ncbi:MAG: glycosyltransferase, partial [Alphaproteobacteria bacterium]|nr:glycosyltransferase [Alphaproteobacteria bacterium]
MISVIMPVYNTASFLRKSIESVLNQTFINFELICVNDGSTDNSLDILNEYASRDSRIIIINQENMGLSCARNSGLEVARGEYIAFIDSDD